MASTKQLVEQAKALAGNKSAMGDASADLAGHAATFQARLKADGADAVGTVAYARTVLDLARSEGIKVPEAKAAKKAASAKGSADADKPPVIKDVLKDVGDDAEKARAALEAEQARGEDARGSLVEKLEAVIAKAAES